MSSAKSIPPQRSPLRNTKPKNAATTVTAYRRCDICKSTLWKETCRRCRDFHCFRNAQRPKFIFIITQLFPASRRKRLLRKYASIKRFDDAMFFFLTLFSHLQAHQDLHTHISILIELFEDRRNVPYAKLKEFFP